MTWVMFGHRYKSAAMIVAVMSFKLASPWLYVYSTTFDANTGSAGYPPILPFTEVA